MLPSTVDVPWPPGRQAISLARVHLRSLDTLLSDVCHVHVQYLSARDGLNGRGQLAPVPLLIAPIILPRGRSDELTVSTPRPVRSDRVVQRHQGFEICTEQLDSGGTEAEKENRIRYQILSIQSIPLRGCFILSGPAERVWPFDVLPFAFGTKDLFLASLAGSHHMHIHTSPSLLSPEPATLTVEGLRLSPAFE